MYVRLDVMHTNTPKPRWRGIALLLGLLGLPLGLACQPPRFTLEVKAAVISSLNKNIDRIAYAEKADFSTWPEVKQKHEAAITAAETPETFAQATNKALEEFKVSHLRLMTPEQTKAYFKNDSVASLGLNASLQEGRWVVFHVEPAGPAAKGGLRRGDVLQGIPLEGTLAKHFEPRREGRRVQLQWLRDAQPQEAELTMGYFPRNEGFSITWLNEEIASLRVPSFSRGRYEPHRIDALLADVRGAKGLVVDMRSNGGGQVAYVAHLLSHFLPTDTPLFTAVDRDAVRKAMAQSGGTTLEGARRDGKLWKARSVPGGIFRGAVVVVVDPFSGSGGELFPGVLQAHGRAGVMGMKSMGAVLGSRVFPLVYGWGAQLPFQEMVTTQGKTLEGRGVVPDHPLKAEVLTRDEVLFAEAINAVKTKLNATSRLVVQQPKRPSAIHNPWIDLGGSWHPADVSTLVPVIPVRAAHRMGIPSSRS